MESSSVLVPFDHVASFIVNANNSITNRRVHELAGLIQLVVHRGDGKRFVVRADEKLSAFVELESAVRVSARPYVKIRRCLTR